MNQQQYTNDAKTGAVPRALFSVDRVPAARRYEVWRDSIACIFDVDRPKEARDEPFHASVAATLLGSVMLAETRTLTQRWERSALTVARDGMDHYMIQLYEAGSMRATPGRRGDEVEIPRDGLMVFDLAQEAISRTNDFRNLSLIVPRPMLEGLLQAPDDQHLRTLTPSEPLVAVLREHMRSLTRHGHRLSARESLELAPATVGLVAACLNANAEATEGGAQGVARSLLAMIRQFIEDRLGDPELGPATIVGRFGVSRANLYRLFAPHGGVAAYIRERRLRHAAGRLLDPRRSDEPIGRIARDLGFADDTSFTRAFRTRFGVPPREARRAGAFDLTARTDGAVGDIDRRYEIWLNALG